MLKKLILALSLMAFGGAALAVDTTALPKKKQTQLGLYLESKDAYHLVKKNDSNTLFVDVRSRAEVNFLGMPTVADANIPYMSLSEFYTFDAKKKNFKMELNDGFLDAVKERLVSKGLNKDSKIIFICRSGSRSAAAANLMAKAGFKNVYTVVDGYEGDKVKVGKAKGQRIVNGWKNNGLPWSYKLHASKMYASDEI